LTTKIHAVVDALGSPVALLLAPGQAADITQAEPLLERLGPEALIADKGRRRIRRATREPQHHAGKGCRGRARLARSSDAVDGGSARHHPALGAPWLDLLGLRLYAPGKAFSWRLAFGASGQFHGLMRPTTPTGLR
jgi:transposase